MVSLVALSVGFLISTIFPLWAVAWAARKAGSPRGRMGVAFVAFIISMIVNLGLGYILGRIFSLESQNSLPGTGLSLVVSLAVTFLVCQKMFRLSFAAAWAPFGAWVGSSVIVVVLVIVAFRPYITEAYKMPTRSMSPTINPGDCFLVNKISRPRRWDLVAYWSTGRDRAIYVKRLIGLPGEHVRFDGGTIYINDQPANVPAILAGRCRASTPGWTEPRYAEGQTISLGSDEYFFIGDNIDISGDSRHAGPSNRSSLVGVVDFIYWPFDKMKIVR
jgi:signal peptidase I